MGPIGVLTTSHAMAMNQPRAALRPEGNIAKQPKFDLPIILVNDQPVPHNHDIFVLKTDVSVREREIEPAPAKVDHVPVVTHVETSHDHVEPERTGWWRTWSRRGAHAPTERQMADSIPESMLRDALLHLGPDSHRHVQGLLRRYHRDVSSALIELLACAESTCKGDLIMKDLLSRHAGSASDKALVLAAGNAAPHAAKMVDALLHHFAGAVSHDMLWAAISNPGAHSHLVVRALLRRYDGAVGLDLLELAAGHEGRGDADTTVKDLLKRFHGRVPRSLVDVAEMNLSHSRAGIIKALRRRV